jgi:hypothetical protein
MIVTSGCDLRHSPRVPLRKLAGCPTQHNYRWEGYAVALLFRRLS